MHLRSVQHDDIKTLESALRRHVSGEVRFDPGTRALYANDGSNYRQVPIGVVLPKSNDDVIAAVALCREHGAPLLCRGGGTSLAGQCCNVAVVLDFTKYMASILELDTDRRIARVQPGVILDQLRAAAEKYHLTFGPDPASHSRCTLGGMIGNNSCGVHSVMSGKTDENIEELEVLAYDGTRMRVGATSETEFDRIARAGGRPAEIYAGLRSLRDQYGDYTRREFPNIPRRVSGYNLNYLLPENDFHVARALVGSEGTCVTVLEATCRLVSSPPDRVLLVIGCRDVFEAADLVPEVLAHKPIGLEGMDDLLIEFTRRKGINSEGLTMLPAGRGWLLAEFGAWTASEAESQARGLMQALGRLPHPPAFSLFVDRAQARKVWEVRESALGAVSYVPGEPPLWEGWEDAAVAPEKLGGYLREFKKLVDSYGYRCVLYGHFGDGCVHTRMSFEFGSAEGKKQFRAFMEDAADQVISFGGSLSGEHGDGQARAELYSKMFSPALIEAFGKFKSLWDPDWKMNPGKVVRPNRLDDNLRLGPDFKPWQPATHFKFPQDGGSIAQATSRCVGVGKCRQYDGGVMCPSFRATREEKHSTRGRAHLLWEMTSGDVIGGQWLDEEVKSSLDLCLSCKGCKSDCPVGVDVASYKAEFLSHHYEKKRRPFSHYAFGHIDRWARLASIAPAVPNFMTQAPGVRDLAKVVVGVARSRKIPQFASKTFRSWFARRQRPAGERRGRVLLWPDTFNNYFHPETAIAAVEVLEAAGFEVKLPRGHVCCGRPLYDFGMLDRARRLLLQTFKVLKDELAAGTPIVVLEPSCAAVFKDELLNFFPQDEQAQRLASQVVLLSEFLNTKASEFELPAMPRPALVHGHCHQKSILRMSSDEHLLRRMKIDFTSPAPGCCGMAGSFGFDQETCDLSLAIGELELLPAVRKAAPDSLIIANGFSCREQIEQTTGRKTLHLAEVIRMGLQGA